MRYEVRCCCNPAKLLGTLEVPKVMTVHERVQFSVCGPAPFSLQSLSQDVDMAPPEVMEFELDDWSFYSFKTGERTHGQALKNREYTLDQLKRISSFVAAGETRTLS